MPGTFNRQLSALSVVAVIAALAWAKDFFLPIAIAALVSFMLAPAVRFIERRGLPRVPAVIMVCTGVFALMAVIIYLVIGQIIDLANDLPGYKSNLREKLVQLRPASGGPFERATGTIRELAEETSAAEQPGAKPSRSPSSPLPVQVVGAPDAMLGWIGKLATPLLVPVGYLAAAALCIIFFLVGRVDLRDRITHMAGAPNVSVTIEALSEASGRVSRYLLAQLMVNVTYGVPLAIGLYFIGIPNALLWGLLATLLRFLPYIGPWIAASFPLMISLAVSHSWREPLLTIGLFVVLELISNNWVEPLLYGSSTGLTPTAVIVSAMFWTWIWGPLGLVIATPLTVCIAVIGRHLPGAGFLTLLIDENVPITVESRLYQRTMAGNEDDAEELVREQISETGAATTLDQVILPVLARIDNESRSGVLGDEREQACLDLIREVIGVSIGSSQEEERNEAASILLVPAESVEDEIAAVALRAMLGCRFSCRVLSHKAPIVEKAQTVAETKPSALCISALASGSLMSGIHLARRLRNAVPDARLWAGFWQYKSSPENDARLARLQRELNCTVLTTFAAAERDLVAAR